MKTNHKLLLNFAQPNYHHLLDIGLNHHIQKEFKMALYHLHRYRSLKKTLVVQNETLLEGLLIFTKLIEQFDDSLLNLQLIRGHFPE